jgi:hypothetical protein
VLLALSRVGARRLTVGGVLIGMMQLDEALGMPAVAGAGLRRMPRPGRVAGERFAPFAAAAAITIFGIGAVITGRRRGRACRPPCWS